MSKECKDEVSRDNNRMGQDYRLNYRLNHACESDINRLCANQCSSSPGTSCGGLVLQCLQVRRGYPGGATASGEHSESFSPTMKNFHHFPNDSFAYASG